MWQSRINICIQRNFSYISTIRIVLYEEIAMVVNPGIASGI